MVDDCTHRRHWRNLSLALLLFVNCHGDANEDHAKRNRPRLREEFREWRFLRLCDACWLLSHPPCRLCHCPRRVQSLSGRFGVVERLLPSFGILKEKQHVRSYCGIFSNSLDYTKDKKRTSSCRCFSPSDYPLWSIFSETLL